MDKERLNQIGPVPIPSSIASAGQSLRNSISFEIIKHKNGAMLASQMDEVYVALLLYLAVFFMNTGSRYVGLIPLAIALCLMTLGPIFWKLCRIRQTQRSLRQPTGELKALPGARVVARGLPEELALVEQIEDVPFEPVIIRKLISIVVYGCLGVLLTIFALVFIFSSRGALRIPGIGLLVMPTGLLLAYFWRQAFPTYYRIVPGRLDIMQFNAITNRRIRFEPWDLRTADITLDFKARSLTIVAAGTGARKEIHLADAAEPYKLATIAVQAAVSTHTAAPLPDDQLLG